MQEKRSEPVDISNSKEALKNIKNEKNKNNIKADLENYITNESETQVINNACFLHWLTAVPVIPCVLFVLGALLSYLYDKSDNLYQKLVLFAPNLFSSFFVLFLSNLKVINFFIFVKTFSTFIFMAFPIITILDVCLEVESDGFDVELLWVGIVYLVGAVASLVLDVINNCAINKKIKLEIFKGNIRQNFKAITFLVESLSYCFLIVGFRLYFAFYFGHDTKELLKNFEFPEWILYDFKLPYFVIYCFFIIAFINIILLLSNCFYGTMCCWLNYLNFIKVICFLLIGTMATYQQIKYSEKSSVEGHVGTFIVLIGVFFGIYGSFFAFALDFNEFKRLLLLENGENN